MCREKKNEIGAKEKAPANQKKNEVKRVVLLCDDMIAKPTLPEPVPSQCKLSMLKICHRNVSKCYGCGGASYEKAYQQEPNDLVAVTKLSRQLIDPKTKVPIIFRIVFAAYSLFLKIYSYISENMIPCVKFLLFLF